MSICLCFDLKKFYDSSGEILNFIESSDCTVTSIALDKIDPKGQDEFENLCRIVTVFAKVDIRSLVEEEFPDAFLDIASAREKRKYCGK